MSNFKDQLLTDLDVFINPNEFADTHNIDGIDVICVIDTDYADQRPRQPEELYNIAHGVYVSTIEVYVKTSDLERPTVEQHMYIDEKLWIVNSCSESHGVYKIKLSSNDV